MGRPKVLLPLRGRTILAWVIDAARSSRCDEVLVVLGEEAARVGEEAARAGARTVLNPRYREGMGTSLAAGVGAVGSWCEAVVVLLGDQPGVAASHIDSLIDGYWRTGRPIVASRYGARRGVPALFARALSPGTSTPLRTTRASPGCSPRPRPIGEASAEGRGLGYHSSSSSSSRSIHSSSSSSIRLRGSSSSASSLSQSASLSSSSKRRARRSWCLG